MHHHIHSITPTIYPKPSHIHAPFGWNAHIPQELDPLITIRTIKHFINDEAINSTKKTSKKWKYWALLIVISIIIHFLILLSIHHYSQHWLTLRTPSQHPLTIRVDLVAFAQQWPNITQNHSETKTNTEISTDQNEPNKDRLSQTLQTTQPMLQTNRNKKNKSQSIKQRKLQHSRSFSPPLSSTREEQQIITRYTQELSQHAAQLLTGWLLDDLNNQHLFNQLNHFILRIRVDLLGQWSVVAIAGPSHQQREDILLFIGGLNHFIQQKKHVMPPLPDNFQKQGVSQLFDIPIGK
jgi:hypothetical protein